MAEPLKYCVILERRAAVPALAEALAKARGTPLADASRAARGAFGLVAGALAEPEARALAEGLAAGGVAALALPESLVEEPPPARALLRCEPREAGLFWTPRDGKAPQLAPWRALALVAAAAFKRAESRVVREDASNMARRALGLGLTLATGIPPSLTGASKREVERRVETSEVVHYADFVFEDLRLRVDAQEFDFSGLGARMSYDAPSNLRRLVTLAFEARPEIPRTEGAWIIGEGRPLREMPYNELADLEREERWLWTLRALKKL